MKTIFALLMALASFAAMADSRKETEQFVDKIYAQTEMLDRHSGNVLQMIKGSISDDDYRSANAAYDEATKFEVKLSELAVLANLYAVMINKLDKAAFKKYYLNSCGYSQKVGVATIERINRSMAGIKSPALLDEVKSMREDSQTLVDSLEFCKK